MLHTLNLRLHPNDLGFIASHAGDRVLLIDESLLPLFEKFRDQASCIERVVVIRSPGNDRQALAPLPKGMLDYERLADVDPAEFAYPEFDENLAAAMCYTSGTTGQPKGVLYLIGRSCCTRWPRPWSTHRGSVERDTLLPVVPMFHANAWGLPFTATMVGAKQVFPGPHLEPQALLDLFVDERVDRNRRRADHLARHSAILDQHPGAYNLKALRAMLVGGSAAQKSMIRGYRERHGLHVLHAWGMTELCPLGTVANLPSRLCDASLDEQLDYAAKQGTPVALMEIRGRNADGIIPWDGKAVGELEVRGPWVASSYYNCPEGAASFTDDGWFRTGDIVAIGPDGCMQLQDRAKDVIKSGGEWISSVALENALMGHPAVAEAAVIPVPHPKWDERPLAVVVLKNGHCATCEELRHVSRTAVRQMVAARCDRVSGFDSPHVGGQIFENRLAQDISRLLPATSRVPRNGRHCRDESPRRLKPEQQDFAKTIHCEHLIPGETHVSSRHSRSSPHSLRPARWCVSRDPSR